MPKAVVDVIALYEALDAKRQEDGLSWRDVATLLHISPSTFSRMAQGKRPDVDTFAALLAWLDRASTDFTRIIDEEDASEPLAMVSSYFRSSPQTTDADVKAFEDILKAATKRMNKERRGQ